LHNPLFSHGAIYTFTVETIKAKKPAQPDSDNKRWRFATCRSTQPQPTQRVTANEHRLAHLEPRSNPLAHLISFRSSKRTSFAPRKQPIHRPFLKRTTKTQTRARNSSTQPSHLVITNERRLAHLKPRFNPLPQLISFRSPKHASNTTVTNPFTTVVQQNAKKHRHPARFKSKHLAETRLTKR
jgi:CelD/BcsL family acetyltransferase involved in cellulose biosynthesis